MTAPIWTQPAAGYQSPAPGGNTLEAITLEFTYDGLSRRVTKKVTTASLGTTLEGFLYDGWNLVMIVELNTSNGAHIKRKWSCIWKPDVGSSMHARASWQAAGGVGGLVWMQTGITQAYYPPYFYGDAEIHVPMADHMGNIRHYFQIKSVAGSVTGQVSGNLEYDAFGREVRAWGPTTGASPPPGLPANKPFIDQLPFHFSSKFTDLESGLNYYGYRFYNAEWGRWLNRDPIVETGGMNLYRAFSNRALYRFDYLGLNDMIIPPSNMGGAYARSYCETKTEPGVLKKWLLDKYPQNPNAPAAGNQIHGYPMQTDMSQWFNNFQGHKVAEMLSLAHSRIRNELSNQCSDGRDLGSSPNFDHFLQTVTPGSQGRPGVDGNEHPFDTPQPEYMARRELGRHNYSIRNTQFLPFYGLCCRCVIYTAWLSISESPGLSKEDIKPEEPFHTTLFIALSGLTGLPYQSPQVEIAKFPIKGIYCCQ